MFLSEVCRCPGIAAQGLLKERVLWESIDVVDVVVLQMNDDVSDVMQKLEAMEDGRGWALVDFQEVLQE
jgi:hypothetical protein